MIKQPEKFLSICLVGADGRRNQTPVKHLRWSFICDSSYLLSFTARKMKFPIKDFFSKCDQIRRKLQISSHLLKKSLMENFIFCAVFCFDLSDSLPSLFTSVGQSHYFYLRSPPELLLVVSIYIYIYTQKLKNQKLDVLE